MYLFIAINPTIFISPHSERRCAQLCICIQIWMISQTKHASLTCMEITHYCKIFQMFDGMRCQHSLAGCRLQARWMMALVHQMQPISERYTGFTGTFTPHTETTLVSLKEYLNAEKHCAL